MQARCGPFARKERSADLKIYYDGRQCRGDPFKIGGTLKWDASKFNAQDHFVFKDADYSCEAHGRKSAR
ncbi:hypothetical protein [uncultured Campylobacter sp.]|uniref:hypothetical protein n=1 Tax=uncultured Campylobacter sp. TaxID=218934 RepID=UPI002610AEA4|nr:hypothetical protein [uncultured Campylobacter sp.]